MTALSSLSNALARVNHAYTDAQDTMWEIVKKEVQAISARFPTRRVEFHSGMGSTFIHIDRRGGYGPHGDSYSLHGDRDDDWPLSDDTNHTLFGHLRVYCETLNLTDAGLGSIAFLGGVEVSK